MLMVKFCIILISSVSLQNLIFNNRLKLVLSVHYPKADAENYDVVYSI